MKISLWLSATDDDDGSISVYLNNTKEEALATLGKESEEEIDNMYDDGFLKEITLNIEGNALVEPFWINIE